jgi:hypothetical protein
MTRPQHSKTEGDGLLQRARANCRAKDAFRIGFGLIWAIDAGFKWQSGFRQGFMGMVMEEGQGQPGWMDARLVPLLDQPPAPELDVLRLHGRGH